MAESFNKKWTYNGVSIFMDGPHFQFATDFCNMMFTSWIEQKQREAAAAAAKKKVIVAED